MLGSSDEDNLALARREDRVLFTQDDDFLRLHASGREHPGIIYARQGTPSGEIIRGLLLICQILDAEEMRRHVEFL